MCVIDLKNITYTREFYQHVASELIGCMFLDAEFDLFDSLEQHFEDLLQMLHVLRCELITGISHD